MATTEHLVCKLISLQEQMDSSLLTPKDREKIKDHIEDTQLALLRLQKNMMAFFF